MKYLSLLIVCIATAVILILSRNSIDHTNSVDDSRTQVDGVRTVDGRFGTSCNLWERGFVEDICYVSFVKLIANPERYDGKLVQVTGFLINVFGVPTLFMNESSYNANVGVEGIELLGAFEAVDGIESQFEGGIFPVTIVGDFDGRYTGYDSSKLGAFRNISHVISSSRRPER